MYKLNFKKRVWIVKQYKKGISASKLHMSLNYKTPMEVWNDLKNVQ